ncbi:MAG TPA: HAD-IB family hydrolase [Acidimicrobiales bacterium]|nr:HAD-IB family hydrolase [Acidimicrobiales bacterium]
MEAAFFDLDKTVIDRASIMAFAGHFRREGLVTRRALARGACNQLVYKHRGASARRLEKVRRSVLAVTKGWDRSQVRRIVVEALAEAVDPITYVEARELIDRHIAEGRRVYLVSAAPAEIVEPIAERLGVHEAVASVARVDAEGRYTGELERYVYASAKAEAVTEIARRDGIDLSASYAYSDSATDVPMLEAVGHPVAVNPDRNLRQAAIERGWEVARFSRLLGSTVVESAEETVVDAAMAIASVAAGEAGEAGRSVEAGRSAEAGRKSRSHRRAWTYGSVAAAVAAAGGGATALAWRSYRSQLGQA